MSGGLEGVIAAETVLSHTDAARGMVWVRGHDLPDLVANHGFEGTIALLWDGFAGDGLTRAGMIGGVRRGPRGGLRRIERLARSHDRPVVVRGRAHRARVSARHRFAGGSGRGDDGDRPGLVALRERRRADRTRCSTDDGRRFVADVARNTIRSDDGRRIGHVFHRDGGKRLERVRASPRGSLPRPVRR